MANEDIDNIQKILRALINNKEIVDESGDIYTLQEVGIKEKGKAYISKIDINSLSDYEVYIDPKDIEIDRLKNIIRTQQEHIQRAVEIKNAEPIRKESNTLCIAEFDEIKLRIEKDPKVKNTKIARDYCVSPSYIGIHLNRLGIRKTKKRK